MDGVLINIDKHAYDKSGISRELHVLVLVLINLMRSKKIRRENPSDFLYSPFSGGLREKSSETKAFIVNTQFIPAYTGITKFI